MPLWVFCQVSAPMRLQICLGGHNHDELVKFWDVTDHTNGQACWLDFFQKAHGSMWMVVMNFTDFIL